MCHSEYHHRTGLEPRAKTLTRLDSFFSAIESALGRNRMTRARPTDSTRRLSSAEFQDLLRQTSMATNTQDLAAEEETQRRAGSSRA